MNKAAIKNFAIWARRKLIAEIKYKAELIGINEKGILSPLTMSNSNIQFFDIGTGKPSEISGNEIKQRKALVLKMKEKEIGSDYKTAYQFIIEEVAYTWFNRIIAIRFMEVNEYLPSGVRVLSSETTGKTEPDIVTRPFETDMEFTPYEKDRIIQLKHENKLNELFRMLFIKQCNKLNEILPELFEKTQDYSELLLTISFTDKDGLLNHLICDIPEEDFKEAVEIIGWMYQYYNEERKNEVINIYKGTIKKEDIPAATQLFTTDWVVRYMVDNSLGRYWIERNPNSKLRDKLTYFIGDNAIAVDEKISPEDLKILDPCMGSGHILVYAFDVLIMIYEESGYSKIDAVRLILQKNIYGLDIDGRAYQLAYFAVMMRARSYSRRILVENISPNLCAIQESGDLKSFDQGIGQRRLDEQYKETTNYLIQVFKNAKEYGSLIEIENWDYEDLFNYIEKLKKEGTDNLDIYSWYANISKVMPNLIKQATILSKQYDVVITNPPYLNKMDGGLRDYVNQNFKDYSGDLFSVFMFRNFAFCKPNGYSAFMTPFVWMFIKTYEKLREYIISNKNISSLIQMEYSAFEEATVPICTFVFKNAKSNQNGNYIKLSEFKGGMEVQKQKVLESISDEKCNYLYHTNDENFRKIPGMPIAYWVSDSFTNIYIGNKTISNKCEIKQGLATCNNNLFVRDWREINRTKMLTDCNSRQNAIVSEAKWFPYNKGGGFRKWYGNNYTVVNWQNDGSDIHKYNNIPNSFQGAPVRAKNFYFREGITYGLISSMAFSARSVDTGFIFDVGGSMVFTENEYKKYIMGLLCSKITSYSLNIINPTLNYQVGDIGKIALVISEKDKLIIDEFVSQNITISKTDWDSFETSWNFITHPLITYRSGMGYGTDMSKRQYKIEIAFKSWKDNTEEQFNMLKANEEELNRIFIDIYGLQDELTPEVKEKDVTIARIYDKKEDIPKSMKGNSYVLTKSDVIKSFISYAVSCMLGRYSLDMEGLAYAGGDWDDTKYKTYFPDGDNCIPITDEEYFSDDILGRFMEFVKVTFGSNTLEENLDFVAKSLSSKDDTSREIIRNYFLNDFYKDHVKTYQKRPIYWLYDSGKQNGFKALIYMHRYAPDTTGLVRVDYLHKLQKIYQNEIDHMNEIIENSSDTREIVQSEKRKEKLIKQLKETKEYDEKVAHIALSRISIDLDDGVKVNYDKVQTDRDGNKFDILGKI